MVIVPSSAVETMGLGGTLATAANCQTAGRKNGSIPAWRKANGCGPRCSAPDEGRVRRALAAHGFGRDQVACNRRCSRLQNSTAISRSAPFARPWRHRSRIRFIDRRTGEPWICGCGDRAHVHRLGSCVSRRKVVPAHHDTEPAGLTSAQRWQRMMDSAGLLIRQGAEDVLFVMNKLTQLNKSGAQGFLLEGRLDLNRIAAVGHSAGGAFATGACQLDARIHACVSLDGEMPPVMAFPEFPMGKDFSILFCFSSWIRLASECPSAPISTPISGRRLKSNSIFVRRGVTTLC
jgi:hypothetical protein